MTVSARIYPHLYDPSARTFSDVPLLTPDLSLRVERYSHRDQGGPFVAQLGIQYEHVEALTQVLDWLRCPVQIVDQATAEPAWWGFVYEIELDYGAFTISYTLDQMTNRVRGVYTLIHSQPARQYAFTMAQNTDSIARYGLKETYIDFGVSSAQSVRDQRDALIRNNGLPLRVPGWGSGSTEVRATLHCRGWDETFHWQLATPSPIRVGQWAVMADPIQDLLTVAPFRFGVTGDHGISQSAPWYYAWRQTPDVVGAWLGLRLYLGKIGKPTDDIEIVITNHNAMTNRPGGILRRVIVPGTSISSNLQAVTVEWDEPLVASEIIWVVVRRTGPLDNPQPAPDQEWEDVANTFTIGGIIGREAAQGSTLRFKNNVWTETLDTLAYEWLIAEEVGLALRQGIGGVDVWQFQRRTDAPGSVGRYVPLLRDPGVTLADRLATLIAAGTGSGERLRYRILPDRTFVVETTPPPDQARLTVSTKVEVDPQTRQQVRAVDTLYRNGQPISLASCPVGVWLDASAVLPTGARAALGRDAVAYIAESEVVVQPDGSVVWSPRYRTG